MRPKSLPPDSNSERLYSISAELKYRAVESDFAGTGRVRTMSRNRIWFESQRRLPDGLLLELAVAWPVLLDQKIPLQLVILGRTAVAGQCICVDIQRHEFRIQPLRRSDPNSLLTPSRAARVATAAP